MEIRQRRDDDGAAVASFLDDHHAATVARRGALVDPLDRPALIAVIDGRLAGLLTYVVDGQQCEILTLHASDQWRGVGSALVEAVTDVAVAQRCVRLTVTTTNDNVDALRFYQRRGFVLARLRPGAVVDSRSSLKPEIPEVGNYGIPLRGEIDLDLDLPMR